MLIFMRFVAVAGALLVGVASHADFFDDFESYTPGPATNGGWKGWDNNNAVAGTIYQYTPYYSGHQTLTVGSNMDAVHEFAGATSGRWEFSVQQYNSSGGHYGNNYVILMNDYHDGGPYSWAVQLICDMESDEIHSTNIEDNSILGTLPMALNQWVRIRVLIDLDLNTVTEYYGDNLLATHEWSGDSVREVKAVDFYADNAHYLSYDDVRLSAIPEPSAAVLLALTGAAAFIFHRIRS
jgi:hypothetical protein